MFFDFKPRIQNESFKEKVAYAFKINYFKLSIVGLCLAIAMITTYAAISSMDVVLKTIPNITAALLIILKALAIFSHKNDIWNIFQELTTIYEAHKNENIKYGVKKQLDGYNTVIKIYFGTFLALSLPVIFPLFPYLISGTMKPTINYWFPFDAFRLETFPIVLIWTNWNT